MGGRTWGCGGEFEWQTCLTGGEQRCRIPKRQKAPIKHIKRLNFQNLFHWKENPGHGSVGACARCRPQPGAVRWPWRTDRGRSGARGSLAMADAGFGLVQDGATAENQAWGERGYEWRLTVRSGRAWRGRGGTGVAGRAGGSGDADGGGARRSGEGELPGFS